MFKINEYKQVVYGDRKDIRKSHDYLIVKDVAIKNKEDERFGAKITEMAEKKYSRFYEKQISPSYLTQNDLLLTNYDSLSLLIDFEVTNKQFYAIIFSSGSGDVNPLLDRNIVNQVLDINAIKNIGYLYVLLRKGVNQNALTNSYLMHNVLQNWGIIYKKMKSLGKKMAFYRSKSRFSVGQVAFVGKSLFKILVKLLELDVYEANVDLIVGYLDTLQIPVDHVKFFLRNFNVPSMRKDIESMIMYFANGGEWDVYKIVFERFIFFCNSVFPELPSSLEYLIDLPLVADLADSILRQFDKKAEIKRSDNIDTIVQDLQNDMAVRIDNLESMIPRYTTALIKLDEKIKILNSMGKNAQAEEVEYDTNNKLLIEVSVRLAKLKNLKSKVDTYIRTPTLRAQLVSEIFMPESEFHQGMLEFGLTINNDVVPEEYKNEDDEMGSQVDENEYQGIQGNVGEEEQIQQIGKKSTDASLLTRKVSRSQSKLPFKEKKKSARGQTPSVSGSNLRSRKAQQEGGRFSNIIKNIK